MRPSPIETVFEISRLQFLFPCIASASECVGDDCETGEKDG